MSQDGQGGRRSSTTNKRGVAKKQARATAPRKLARSLPPAALAATPPSVILTAGHRNKTNGGAPGEMARTPRFAHAYRDALRAAGYAVFYVQEMNADGDPDTFAGSLAAVAAKVRAIAATLQGDRLVMFDLHLEEGAAPRGVFTIVPDDPAATASGSGDVWKNNAHAVRLGHLVAERIALRAGFVQRNAKELGVMSERQTGVGEKGSRLGMFSGTAALRDRMARLIVEHGNIVKDRAIIDDPQTPARCAAAVVDALAVYFSPTPTIA